MQTVQPQPQVKVKTAGEVYKNIQVLKDLPADQLDNVMTYFAGSLGVKCNFCHVPNQWEKDDKEEKHSAREMITMTLGINKANFSGRLEVTCATCHNGHSHPQGMPVLGESIWARPPFDPKSRPALPTIDQVIDKYITALGGKAALEKITSYSLKGTRTDVDGKPVPEEIVVRSPDKMLVTVAYPKAAMVSGLSGTSAWVSSERGAADMHTLDAEQFRRDAQFFQPANIRSIYKEMSVVAIDKIDDKPVYVIRAVTQNDARERLYFDVASGLLVRGASSRQITIGNYLTWVDYGDYREAGGVKVPFSIKWSVPGQTWTLKAAEVKTNTAIDAAKFARPSK